MLDLFSSREIRMKEQTLSDKLHGTEEGYNNIREEDVREFIKKLKDEILSMGWFVKDIYYLQLFDLIDKLAGDKLTKKTLGEGK